VTYPIGPALSSDPHRTTSGPAFCAGSEAVEWRDAERREPLDAPEHTDLNERFGMSERNSTTSPDPRATDDGKPGYVWVQDRNALAGEYLFCLDSSRKFVLPALPEIDEEGTRSILYLTPEGRWIEYREDGTGWSFYLEISRAMASLLCFLSWRQIPPQLEPCLYWWYPAEADHLPSKTRAGTQSEAKETTEQLTPNDWRLLRAFFDLGADDPSRPATRSRITGQARTGCKDSLHNRRSFARLKTLGLIDAVRSAGTWLTRTGASLAAPEKR